MKLNANTAACRAKKPHCFLRIPARCYLWDLQKQIPLGEGSAQARTSQAQKQKYQAFIRSSRAELCPGAPVPPSWGWGSAAAGSPHPQDITSLSSSLWIPLSCCCQLWVGQTKELPLGKAKHRKGRGKNKFKKRINHTLDTVITMRRWMSCFTSTWQIISQAGKWGCWVSSCPGGGGCWFAGSWHGMCRATLNPCYLLLLGFWTKLME